MKQRRWVLWFALLAFAVIGFASLSTSKDVQPTLAPGHGWSLP